MKIYPRPGCHAVTHVCRVTRLKCRRGNFVHRARLVSWVQRIQLIVNMIHDRAEIELVQGREVYFGRYNVRP